MTERSAVFSAARDFGFVFDDTLISTAYGVSETQIVMTGSMGGPVVLDGTGDKNDKIEYKQAVFDLKDGNWVFNSATPEK